MPNYKSPRRSTIKLRFLDSVDGKKRTYEKKNLWVDYKNELYPTLIETFAEWINQLIERDPHKGLSPSHPIPEITELQVTVWTKKGSIVKSFTTKYLGEDDPPLWFIYEIPTGFDEYLEKYHKARKGELS